MPWAKGQSGNPGGRPKQVRSIRASAKVDSRRAYDRLAREMDHEDPRIAVPACVNILKLAGVSFASDAEETKAQVEASKAVQQSTPSLEEAAGSPELPLN